MAYNINSIHGRNNGGRPTEMPHDYIADFKVTYGGDVSVRGYSDGKTIIDHYPHGRYSDGNPRWTSDGLPISPDRLRTYTASRVKHDPVSGELSFDGGTRGGYEQGIVRIPTSGGEFTDNRVRGGDTQPSDLPIWATRTFGELSTGPHPESAPTGEWKLR